MDAIKLIEYGVLTGTISEEQGNALSAKASEPDKFDDIVVKRILVAKGFTTKEAGKLLGVDSSFVQRAMQPKPALGDNKGEGWSASSLRRSKYSDIFYPKDELKALIKKYPGLKRVEDRLLPAA